RAGEYSLVPAAAAGRHDRGAADGPAARLQPVRRRPAAPPAGNRRPAGQRRPAGTQGPGHAAGRGHGAGGAARGGRGSGGGGGRGELLRTAMADLLGRSGPEQTGETLTTVAAVTIESALQVAVRSVTERRGVFPTRVCVVAMGRLGGHESGYGSDADVMFVHDPLPGAGEREAAEAAPAAAQEVRALLARPAPDPPPNIDPDLRPEGR